MKFYLSVNHQKEIVDSFGSFLLWSLTNSQNHDTLISKKQKFF